MSSSSPSSSSFRPFNAYIVGACRSAAGRRNGLLSQIHPIDLAATVVDELVSRTGVDPSAVDDVICGCVMQVGAQAANIGRNIVLSSRVLPITVPGTTVDRQCGSSQQSFHFAVQGVMSGTQDCVIACGVESMSKVPMGSPVRDVMAAGRGFPKGELMEEKWPGVHFTQFEGAELLAQKYGVSREEMDDSAYHSHRKAYEATQSGRFTKEIVPVLGKNPKTGEEVMVTRDEGIRWPASREKIGKLRTLKPGGLITAATASQISDGASAVMVCNERGLARLGLTPRARVVDLALAGSDPVIMLEGPIPATHTILKRTGLDINRDIDLYEVNEAFASVPLAWQKALGADPEKLNVNGGAMALGHPLGCTGAKLLVTLVHELERRKADGARRGLLTICEGGGTSNALIIELVDHKDVKSRL